MSNYNLWAVTILLNMAFGFWLLYGTLEVPVGDAIRMVALAAVGATVFAFVFFNDGAGGQHE